MFETDKFYNESPLLPFHIEIGGRRTFIGTEYFIESCNLKLLQDL